VTCVWQKQQRLFGTPLLLPARPSKLPRVFHTSVLLQICIKCRLEPHLCSVLRLQHTHNLFHERSLLLRTCSLPPTQAPNVSVKPALSRRVLWQYLDPICIIAETVAALCSSSTWSYPYLNKVPSSNSLASSTHSGSAGGRASVVSKGAYLTFHAEVASSLDKHSRETRLQNLLSPFIKPFHHQTWRLQEHNRSRLDFPRHNLTYM
jgi:hypothetical protein